ETSLLSISDNGTSTRHLTTDNRTLSDGVFRQANRRDSRFALFKLLATSSANLFLFNFGFDVSFSSFSPRLDSSTALYDLFASEQYKRITSITLTNRSCITGLVNS